LEARYFAEERASGAPEWSSEFPGRPFTRLDRTLDFEGPRFPLYFLNDNLRFNFYTPDRPDRQTLPFIARWRGLLDVPGDGEYRFWLKAAGQARLDLRGAPRLEVASDGDVRTTEHWVRLKAGQHPVALEYRRLAGRPALLSLEWDLGGPPTAIGAPHLLAAPAPLPGQLSGALSWTAQGLDLLYLVTVAVVALLFWIRRESHAAERPLLALLLALVLGYAVLTSLELDERVVILDGGADWLTYETYARDIQENGPLMTLGRPVGRGRPFFFQPFYPYALAAYHWLGGEDLFAPVVLQIFGVGVAGVLVSYCGRRLFGVPSGIAALAVVLGILGPLQFDWVARRLLSENVYFWFLPATALALIALTDSRSDRRPSAALATLAGLLLGLCCITRGPTLLWIPPVLAITFQRLRTGPGALSTTVILAAICASVVALVPLRNWIVSGQPSLVATNGVATIELAHPLTPEVDLRGVEQNPIYRALKIDYAVIQLLEFVRQDPDGYGATLVPLGLYALGLPEMLEPGSAVRWELFGLVLLYGGYCFSRLKASRGPLSARLRTSLAGPSAALYLHSFIGLHFMVMMIFLPNVYGFRQVLPMYLFLAVFGGSVVAEVLARFVGLASPATAEQGKRPYDGRPIEKYVPRAGTTSSHEKLA
jgi:hypothetical protein